MTARPPEKPYRSGPTSSYAQRAARGMPNRTFALPTAIDEGIGALAARLGLSRSQVVGEAVRLLAQRERIKIDDKG